jgi:hypothetical protein
VDTERSKSVSWPYIAAHGIPYADPQIGAQIALVQCEMESEVGARSLDSIRRELAWLTLSGSERIYHPFCGPGSYAEQISSKMGCRWYLGQDINPAAVNAARLRCRNDHYHFQTIEFGPCADPPRHDLCLLTYETINTFPPEIMKVVIQLVAKKLSSRGRLFLDVHPPCLTELPAVVEEAKDIPAGEGIFLAAAHRMTYTTEFHAGGRLYLERFNVTDGHTGREFYSWLWLHDPEEITKIARGAGLEEVGRAALHREFMMHPPAGHSIQMLFRVRK